MRLRMHAARIRVIPGHAHTLMSSMSSSVAVSIGIAARNMESVCHSSMC